MCQRRMKGWRDGLRPGLAIRVRELLGDRSGLAEKRMFGGLAFPLNGNMACGVRGDELIVRVAAEPGHWPPEPPLGWSVPPLPSGAWLACFATGGSPGAATTGCAGSVGRAAWGWSASAPPRPAARRATGPS